MNTQLNVCKTGLTIFLIACVSLFHIRSAVANPKGNKTFAPTEIKDQILLRKKYPILEVRKEAWDTHAMVNYDTLDDIANCTAQQSKLGAFFIETDDPDEKSALWLIFDNGESVKKELNFGGSDPKFPAWMTTPKNTSNIDPNDPSTWDYYIYLTAGKKSEKHYNIEIFVNNSFGCLEYRPENSVSPIQKFGVVATWPNNGSGNEPEHP